MTNDTLTGGCQCGAVRYALSQVPENPSICHCLMCQKAFGSYYAPLAGVPRAAFAITRGELATFMSSDEVERGFCRDCGTPLTFRYVEDDAIDISLGSLDDPAAVKPVVQYGLEARMPWLAELDRLPGKRTDQVTNQARLERIRDSNHQHPDYNTDTWPPLSEGPAR